MDFKSLIAEYQHKVLINCMTYNHSAYIEDALNGFVMQQTNFRFVCLVMDDASTDGEQDVIMAFLSKECDMTAAKNYRIDEAEVIVTPHKINKNCTLSVYFLKKNLYGTGKKTPLIGEWSNQAKYIALCEGDDYWRDPLKLQKQVDFLERNEEYSLCCSDVVVKSMNGDLDWSRYSESCKVPIEDIITGGGLWLQTVSYVYRNKPDVLNNYPDCCKRCHVGDYPLIIWMALHGGVYYIAEKTAVYRFQCEGSWTSKQKNVPLEKQIVGWRSEIDMLLGLDKWSQGKYSEAFSERIAKYLYNNIILPNKDDSNKIMREFHDVKHLLSKKQRIHIFFLNIHQEKTLHRLVTLKRRIKK